MNASEVRKRYNKSQDKMNLNNHGGDSAFPNVSTIREQLKAQKSLIEFKEYAQVNE
jgi:hypothetical protein